MTSRLTCSLALFDRFELGIFVVPESSRRIGNYGFYQIGPTKDDSVVGGQRVMNRRVHVVRDQPGTILKEVKICFFSFFLKIAHFFMNKILISSFLRVC